MLRKTRTILNQQVMIKNRDKLIEDLQLKVIRLESRLRDIKAVAESNLLETNIKAYIDKINELAKTGIQH